MKSLENGTNMGQIRAFLLLFLNPLKKKLKKKNPLKRIDHLKPKN